MNSAQSPQYYLFDPTPEIFATDTGGGFTYLMAVNGESYLDTGSFDEIRFVFSIWYPSGQRAIDLDRSFVEVRACFTPEEEHWTRLAEMEPVVPPYAGGDSFDGWIPLPVLGDRTAFALVGSGFEPRARVQVRASAYLVP